MGCSNGGIQTREKKEQTNKNPVKTQNNNNINNNQQNKNNNEIIQRRRSRINSLRTSIIDRKESENKENILTHQKSKQIVLNEKNGKKKSKLSLIKDEFKGSERKKSRSKSMRTNKSSESNELNEDSKKKRKLKRYRTEKINKKYKEELLDDQNLKFKLNRNERKSVTIKSRPIYFNENKDGELYTINENVRKNRKILSRRDEKPTIENYEVIDSQGKKRIEFRKTRSYTLTNTLNEDFAKNKKRIFDIRTSNSNNYNNTLEKSSESNSFVKKSNLKSSNSKIISYEIEKENTIKEENDENLKKKKSKKYKRTVSNVTNKGSIYNSKKTPLLNLQGSNKDSNSLSDESESKLSGRLYSLENNKNVFKQGRKSIKQISIRDFVKNNNVKKKKKELPQILEKERLSNLILKDKNWDNIYNELFDEFDNLFKGDDKLKDKINILVLKNFNIEKKEGRNSIYKEIIKINILNKVNNNWDEDPLKQIKTNIYNLISKEKYKKYSLINFDTYYKEYEKIPQYLKLPLFKCSSNSNKEEYIIDFSRNDKVKVIFFFNIKDINSLLALKKLSNYYQENKELFYFFPIYQIHIKSINEINNIKKILENNEVPLESQEIYFIFEEKSHLIKKSFLYQIDYDSKKQMSKLYLIDKDNILRYNSNLIDFQIGMINNINEAIEKQDFIYELNTLINLFEKQKTKSYKANLNFRKAIIYDYDTNKNTLIESKKIYEGITGNLDNNINLEKAIIENVDIDFSPLIHKSNSNNNSDDEKEEYSNLEDKEEELNNIIKSEINNFSNQIGGEINDFNCIYTYIYNLYSIINEEYPEEKIKKKEEEHFKLEFLLNPNLFEQQFQFALINSMNNIFKYPDFNNIDYLSCVPCLNKTFSIESKLIDPNNNFDKNLIQIIYPHQPNLILVISYTTNYLLKTEIESRFNKIKKCLNDNFNIIVIFKGEQNEYQSIIEDLYFISENNLKVYISDSTDTNFPLHFNASNLNTENPSYYILINKNGNISYVGNFTNIKIENFFNDFEVFENEIPINEYLYDEMKREEIKYIIKNLENLIQTEFENIKEKNPLKYRPLIQISYDKKYNNKNNKENIENIKIKIIIKERHKKIFTSSAQIKNIFKILRQDYNALILIIPLQCETLMISENCEMCGEKVGKEPFYLEQKNNIIYCLNCEELLKKRETHLIYFKTEDYDKEIISDFYNSNIYSNEALNKEIPDFCCLCDNKLGTEFYLSLTQFNVKEGYSPLVICDDCFNDLNINGNLYDQNDIYNKNIFCIHEDNIILRKVLI